MSRMEKLHEQLSHIELILVINVTALVGGYMANNTAVSKTTKDLVLIALATVLIAICSWISIPFQVPVTLQTFAIFAVTGLLGLKRGTLAVLLYILLGAVGIPVFAGFSGGPGYLVGVTGGYIIGFIFSALAVGLITHYFGKTLIPLIISMILGLLICYTFGTAWFIQVYSQTKGAVDIVTALTWCVFPFVIFDAAKIVLAVIVVNRLSKYVRI